MTTKKTLSVPGAIAPAYCALPAGTPKGAVVVAHEIFGRAPEMERVCERFASAGYAAILPDLFGDRFKPLCIRKCMVEVMKGEGENIEILQAAAGVVAAEAGVDRSSVFVIGFCLGGGFALAVGHAFKAVSANYATVLPPAKNLARLPPTIACWAKRDKSVFQVKPAVNAALAQKDGCEVHEFDAGHAFLADGAHPWAEFLTRPLLDVGQARDAAVREEAWPKIFAFFERQLSR